MQSGMERMSQIPIDKETQIKAMVSRGRGVTQGRGGVGSELNKYPKDLAMRPRIAFKIIIYSFQKTWL